MLTGNWAYFGGGAYSDTLNNCTLIGNSAVIGGGGAYSGTLNNCIVYYNILHYNTDQNEVNYTPGSLLNYCCTMPLPTTGDGNMTNEPLFVNLAAGDFHLKTNSPCINAGNNAYAPAGPDLDGNPRIVGGTVDIGAYECQTVVPFTIHIQVNGTNAAVGFPFDFTGTFLGGVATTTFWDFGDGTTVSNQLSVSHSWSSVGVYPVVFTAFNDSIPGGISATVTIYVSTPTVSYVNINSANPVSPYSSWDTAATNIQDAVDVALPNQGSLVLVTNGVYQTGGRIVTGGTISNRVIVTEGVAVQSINGPAVTIIQGHQVPGTINDFGAVRCVYLADGATLSGFTLTNGATKFGNSDFTYESTGGGVVCESTNSAVTNCVLINNSAGDWGGGISGGTLNRCLLIGNSTTHYGYSAGGGAYNSVLNNCALTGNSSDYGGGVEYSTLNNCTLTGNSAGNLGAGGVGDSLLNNCIVYYNSASIGPNSRGCTFNFCCTVPLPDSGAGNITNAPLFVDQAGGNFRLQRGSPCINAGNNSYVSTMTDLDGNPRIMNGTVDIGAYEFEFPIHYVDLNCTNPIPPYTNWTQAAANIQDAIDAAEPGDQIIVTNGVYSTGGRAVPPYLLTNRVVVDKAVMVQSVNGPEVTVIQGNQPIADSAVRCAYLTNGAALIGFTLTNGATRSWGDWFSEESGGGVWCESSSVVISNCVLTGNLADSEGGGVLRRRAEQLHSHQQLSSKECCRAVPRRRSLRKRAEGLCAGGQHRWSWGRGILWHSEQLHDNRQLG